MKSVAKTKIYIVRCLVLMLAVGILIIPRSTFAVAAYGSNVYRTIAKIYTYYLDESNVLTLAGTGSGVLIRNDGTVLTNSHVINHKDSSGNNVPTTFKVCYNGVWGAELPECNFTAIVIADDPVKDVALIRMLDLKKNMIPDAYNLNPTDGLTFAEDLEVHDDVLALGYPDFGDGLLMSIKGEVSGFENDGVNDWILSDLIFSFGSSGGALVDEYGRILGITSQITSESGRSINIKSVYEWIKINQYNTPQMSELTDRAINLIKLHNDLLTVQAYTIDEPKILIEKPTSWQFDLRSENQIKVYKPNTENTGSYEIIWITEQVFENLLNAPVGEGENDISDSCSYDGDVLISGHSAGHFACTSFGSGRPYDKLILPYNSHVFAIILDYQQDKALIDATLESIFIDLPPVMDNQNEVEEQVNSNSVVRPARLHTFQEVIEGINSKIIWNGKKVYSSKPSILPVGYMIKADSDPKSYLVMPDGTLRWVETEAVAKRIFGPDWDSQILWLDEALVYTYSFGEKISE